jgi:hypothetical protein
MTLQARVLHLRQSIPVEKIFMPFLETEQMNCQCKETAAVLLHDTTT